MNGDPSPFYDRLRDLIDVTMGSTGYVCTQQSDGTFAFVAPTGGNVTSVAGRTGAVVLAEADITSLVADLAAKAPLASPTFTGTPAAPTAVAGTNTAQLATTAFTHGEIAALGLGTVSTLAVDTDTALAANSDTRVASQKAVKAYADALIAANDAMVFKGVVDASANPNYPAADRGHVYKISVAGKIGGASGVNVEVGDTILCITDGTAAGNQATVGANWVVVQVNLDGAVIGPATSVDGTFALYSGSTGKLLQSSIYTAASFQTADAELTALAGLISAADKLPYFTGLGTAALADFTTTGRSIVASASAQAARDVIGSVTGIWPPSLGGTGNTALTAGSIPFIGSSGIYTQAHTKLSWDSSNDRCLISKGGSIDNSPQSLLHVRALNDGSTNGGIQLEPASGGSGSGTSTIQGWGTSTGSLSVGLYSTADALEKASIKFGVSTIALRTAATDRLTISATGAIVTSGSIDTGTANSVTTGDIILNNGAGICRIRPAGNDMSLYFGFNSQLYTSNSTTADTYSFMGITRTNTSGATAHVAIKPTYNQASGSAANYDLLVNRIETALGSGAQRLILLQVNAVDKFLVDNKGNVVPGSAALATTATDGFTFVECGAGPPTGLPTSFTGRAPLYYDTTNHQLWLYDSGWKPIGDSGPITLTDAATVAIDASLGNWFLVTTTASRIIGNPTGAVAGRKYMIEHKQGGTGGYAPTFGTKWVNWTGLSYPTNTLGKRTRYSFVYNGVDDKFEILGILNEP